MGGPLTNLSENEPWHDPAILAYAFSGEVEGDRIYSDGYCCGGEGNPDFPDFLKEEVPPGESLTHREEFSVADASNVTLELDIEGLAGHSIAFTN